MIKVLLLALALASCSPRAVTAPKADAEPSIYEKACANLAAHGCAEALSVTKCVEALQHLICLFSSLL